MIEFEVVLLCSQNEDTLDTVLSNSIPKLPLPFLAETGGRRIGDVMSISKIGDKLTGRVVLLPGEKISGYAQQSLELYTRRP